MSEQIGALSVDLTADVAAYQQAMRAATKTLEASTKGWTGAISGAQRSIEGLFAPILGLRTLLSGLAAGGFVMMIKGALNAAGSLQDLSDQTGASTDNIQALQYILAQSGVGAEDSAAALRKFTQNVGDAKNGAGELVTSLYATDRAFLDLLRGAPTMDAALQIAFDKLASIPGAAQRAALAADLFGKQGVKLAAIVKDGSINFGALTEQMRGTGALLDSELIAKADEAGDQLLVLGQHLERVRDRAIIPLVPWLVKMAKGWESLIALGQGEFFPKFDKLADITLQLYDIDKALAALDAQRKSVAAGMAGGVIPESLGGIRLEAIDKQEAALKKQRAELGATNKALYSEAQASTAATDVKKQATAASADNVKELKIEVEAQKKLAEELGKVELAHVKLLGATDDLNDKRIAAANKSAYDTSEEARLQQIEFLSEALKEGTLSWDAYRAEMEKARGVHAAIADDALDWAKIMHEVGLTMGDAFADAIVDGKRLDEIVKALERDLLRMAIRGGTVGLFDKLFGAGVIGNTGGTGQSYADEFAGGYTPMATGGYVQPNSWALVGENGPELMAVGRGGATVIPNDALGGVNLVQHFDFRGADSSVIPRVEAMIRAAAPQIIAQSVSAVADTRKRGGRV
jgi:hypothetical protein